MQTPGNPSVDQLLVLLAVVEEGSFTRAAKRLRRANSAVSYAIDTLEAQLGVSLFDRGTTRKPKLTDAGEAVVSEREADAYAARYEEAITSLANAAAGVLWRLSPSRGRVALVPAIIVTGATTFLGDHPGVSVSSPSPVMVMEHPAADVADAASVMAAISPLCTPAPGLPPFADVYKTDWPVW